MPVTTIILALSLIIIMFGMGLSLTLDDFKRVFIEPKAIITGLICQLLLLPALGFGLIALLDLRPEIAIGLVILTACPGGPTSNLITHLANGDTALSVSLTAISSFITLVTIPLVINLGLEFVLGSGSDIQLNVTGTIAQVFVVVIFPVTVGMLIRARKSDFAHRMERPVRNMSAIVFVLVLLGVIVSEWETITSHIREVGGLSLGLNILTMAMGIGAARLLNLPMKQAISISIESGIQNGTLAIAIATGILMNTSYAITPAIYGILMFFTAAAVIFWSSRQKSSD